MQFQKKISDHAWGKIYQYLTGFSKIHTSNEERIRRFLEAVFWMVKSGSQ